MTAWGRIRRRKRIVGKANQLDHVGVDVPQENLRLRPLSFFSNVRRIVGNSRRRGFLLITLSAMALVANFFAHLLRSRRPVRSLLSLSTTFPPDNISVRFPNSLWEVTMFESEDSFKKGLSRIDPEYGGLEVVSPYKLPDKDFRRLVKGNDSKVFEEYRNSLLDAMDTEIIAEKLYSFEDREFDPHGCVSPKWKYQIYPTCNSLHELALELSPEQTEQGFDIKYLARGHFRESYLFESLYKQKRSQRKRQREEVERNGASPFVLKHLRYYDHFTFNQRILHSIHKEALTMEILSGSPRTSDFYGFCATSILVQKANELTYRIVPKLTGMKERGRISQEDLDKLETEDVHPMNDLSAPEKLSVAIAMAEALAELHGYAKGVILHDDVHPDQWLVTDEGRVILNDINNAAVLDWNIETENYCPFSISYGGDFRAPEEFRGGAFVDESVDVWPMGNLIFSILTGLWPYYTETDDKLIQKTAIKGIPPYLDPRYANRSMVEARLVDVMGRCHKLEPDDRVSIFEVVKHLRETLRMYREQEGAKDGIMNRYAFNLW